MKIKLVVSLILAALAAIFIYQNTDIVKVDFMTWSVDMSLVLLVFIMLGSGVVIGWLLNSYSRFVRTRKRAIKAENSKADDSQLPDNAESSLPGGKHVHE